jgi:hypothetical protein
MPWLAGNLFPEQSVDSTMAHEATRRLSAVVIVWMFAITILKRAYPVFWDGDGPMPSFFYRGHSPTLQEYREASLAYDVHFLLPYCVVASIMCIICFSISPLLTKKLIGKDSKLVGVLFSVMLLLTAAGISDGISHLGSGHAVFFSRDLLLIGKHVMVAGAFATASAIAGKLSG